MFRPSTLVNPKTFRFLTPFIAFAWLTANLPVAEATPCVAFDADFNLYAFGFGGKDFQLGTQDKWASTVSPTDVTSNGRPPFDGPQTTCYLAQFFNAIYVLDGDKANPLAVHIYDAQAKSWSTQQVNPGGPDPSSLVAILDHDTNVFYALGDGSMYSLDLGQQKAANSNAATWNLVGKPSFDTTNYKPTMALAQNHIHFIGVPNSQAGTADIFVIHFSFFQPDAQAYTVSGGPNSFPSTHGQTASFFKSTGVQEEFAFIPDDFSATYVVNVESNTTVPLAGPSDKSPSTYAASISALVQLTSSGSISFIPYTPGNTDQSRGASWSKINVQGLPTVAAGPSWSSGPASGPASGSASGTPIGGAGNGTGTAQGSGGTGGSGRDNSGAISAGIGITTLMTIAGAFALGLSV